MHVPGTLAPRLPTAALTAVIALLTFLAPLAPVEAQLAPSATVGWSPERPVQGTLFTIRLSVPDGAEVGGSAAGEPLHFHRADDGARVALAAVPIDSAGALTVALEIRHVEGSVETRTLEVPITPGTYRLQRLTVAPRYGTPPDSALAARIAAEAARAREVSLRSHGTPRLWDGDFLRPRESRVTSGFGHGREFNGQVQSRHMGTDLAGAVGAPVRATARGIVALVDSFHLGGNVVYLDHGAGLVSAYLHLSRAEVVAGETVEAGQVIGRVGASGRVTGPHLHWIVRYGTITVDPLSLLELRAPALPTL